MTNTPLNADELREIEQADTEVQKIIIKLINYIVKGEPSSSTRINPKQAEEALLADRKKQIEQAYSDGFQKASKGAFKSQQAAKREAVEAVLDRLEKSMPTVEQLTTKYGYHMPEKQYGYKIGLHDIREVIEAERNKLKEQSNE